MAEVRPVHWAPVETPPARPLDASARVGVPAISSHHYFSGSVSGARLSYVDLASFAWWSTPTLDAPVRLRLHESLRDADVFPDPTLEAAFLPMVDLPLGSMYRIGDELASPDLYEFRIASKGEGGGLISYTGESLLADLDRERPAASLVVIPGAGDVPDPLTPREALLRFLDYYGVPYTGPVPEFYLRVPDGVAVPHLNAFVVRPDPERPASIYEYLGRFFRPFSGYTFRANEDNVLEISPPTWLELQGVTLRLRRLSAFGITILLEAEDVKPWPWGDRRPEIRIVWGVFGAGQTVHELTLDPDTPALVTRDLTDAEITIEWDTEAGMIEAEIANYEGDSWFAVGIRARPEQVEGRTFAQLTQADMGIEETVVRDLDTVINRATMTVRPWSFEKEAQIMEPAAALLRSPEAVPDGVYPPRTIGPATEPSDEPLDRKILFNREGLEAIAFWPVAEDVVIQPGSPVKISLEIEEWRDEWGPFLVYAGAELVHTASVDFELPPNGERYEIHELNYPKYGIGGTSARGFLYARWLTGESPGVQFEIIHQPAMSGWTITEGQKYFLYGVLAKLNGTGIAFTESGEAFTVSFGYTEREQASVPGLGDSVTRFGEREARLDLGIFDLDPATALSVVRSVVEAEYNPKLIHTLEIVPSPGADGYKLRPWHVGRTVRLVTGEYGTLRAYDYNESHAPGSSSSRLSAEIEVESRLAAEKAARRHYGRAKYRASHYQEPEEE